MIHRRRGFELVPKYRLCAINSELPRNCDIQGPITVSPLIEGSLSYSLFGRLSLGKRMQQIPKKLGVVRVG